jgi:hypothetical protein
MLAPNGFCATANATAINAEPISIP